MTYRKQECPVIAESPPEMSHFIGFHDICPWDQANAVIALQRCRTDLLHVPRGRGDEVAEICTWSPETGRVEVVAETRAFNFQIGSRVQWVPGQADRLVWNHSDGKALYAREWDRQSGEIRDLPFTVFALSPDGHTALSPHFARLHRSWLAYGFPGGEAPQPDHPSPDQDGMWVMDMETGETRLLVSIARLVEEAGGNIGTGAMHFVTHPSFNPAGDRFVFLHRFFTTDGALYTRLLVSDLQAGTITPLIEEKVSHFCWLDDTRLIVWARSGGGGRLAAARKSGLLGHPVTRRIIAMVRKLSPGLKQSLFNESYQVLDVNTGRKIPVARGLLEQDGHPMLSPDGRHIITDTYTQEPDNAMPLILFDRETGTRTDIQRFVADDSVSHDSDIKCDLHPRWDRTGRYVAVDTTRNGPRQVAIVDAGPVIAGQ